MVCHILKMNKCALLQFSFDDAIIYLMVPKRKSIGKTTTTP